MVLGALDIKTADVAIKLASVAVNAPFDVKRERVIGPGTSACPPFHVILQLETPLVFNRRPDFDGELCLRPEWLRHENCAQPLALEIAVDPSSDAAPTLELVSSCWCRITKRQIS